MKKQYLALAGFIPGKKSQAKPKIIFISYAGGIPAGVRFEGRLIDYKLKVKK